MSVTVKFGFAESPSLRALAGLALVTVGINTIIVLPRLLAIATGTPATSWPRGKTEAHPGPEFVKRAVDAYANSVENLAPAATIILAAAALGKLGVTNKTAPVLLALRVAQAAAHIALPQTDLVVLARSALFAPQLAIQFWWALKLLGAL